MPSRIVDGPGAVPAVHTGPVVLDGSGLGVEEVVRLADGAVRPVPGAAAPRPGLRLLRSHAGAIGEELPARQVRAMLAMRANQLSAGGAGLCPGVVTALCDPELLVGRAPELAESVLDPEMADRSHTDDVPAAAALLDRFTDIWRGSTA